MRNINSGIIEYRIRTHVDLFIWFIPSGIYNVYHLEFGPLNYEKDDIDTHYRVGKNHHKSTFHTIACILVSFLRYHPDAMIKFSAEDKLRMRLFTMWISSHWTFVTENFIFYGYNLSGEWETYRKNGRYGAVMLKQKTYNNVFYQKYHEY